MPNPLHDAAYATPLHVLSFPALLVARETPFRRGAARLIPSGAKDRRLAARLPPLFLGKIESGKTKRQETFPCAADLRRGRGINPGTAAEDAAAIHMIRTGGNERFPLPLTGGGW
jgi:hypothetical protein